MNSPDSFVLEGISCTGKSSALSAFLASPAWTERAGLSSLVLTEHHTIRTLEALPQPTPTDYFATLYRTADYLQALAEAQARTDWDERGRKNHRLSVVLERFHLSALLPRADLGRSRPTRRGFGGVGLRPVCADVD